MRKINLLLIILMILSSFVGCASPAIPEEVKHADTEESVNLGTIKGYKKDLSEVENLMVIVEEYKVDDGTGSGTRYRIIVDSISNVMYLTTIRYSNGFSTTTVPLYNADGTLRIYDGDLQ